jgi:acyl-CoA synthetase (AMP-forming)/AMP-acid ligase II
VIEELAPVSELVVRAARWARDRPDAIACQVGGRRPRAATYGEVARSVEVTAAALARAGVRPGMRAVLLVFPGVELGVLALALLRLGAVPVLADPGLPYREVGRCLNAAAPEAFVGIPLAHAARLAFGWGRGSRVRVTVGPRLWPGTTLARLRAAVREDAGADDEGPPRVPRGDAAPQVMALAPSEPPGGIPYGDTGLGHDSPYRGPRRPSTAAEPSHDDATPQATALTPSQPPGGIPYGDTDLGHDSPYREPRRPSTATGPPHDDATGELGGHRRGDGPVPRPREGGAARRDGVASLVPSPPSPDDLAVIAYTSGSTGPPKGVPLRHRHLAAQLDLLGPLGLFRAGAPMLSTFTPFTLGAAALGATAVIPELDPRRPIRADPASLVADIRRYGVETVFAAPALLDRLARHCVAGGIVLDGVRDVAVAGAPLPWPTLRRVRACLPADARVLSVYGATECLPVAAIDGRDLAAAFEAGADEATGTCLGIPVPGTLVRVIALDDGPIPRWRDDLVVPPGVVGEIVVASPAVGDPYLDDPAATALARIEDGDRVWHRMGDLGHLDSLGRLWFGGRKSERVRTAHGDLCTDHVETFFATVPGVRRTALVGVGPPGAQRPALVVERERGTRRADVRARVAERAAAYPRGEAVREVLFHPRLPVDVRHNSKIRRGELAAWASRRLCREGR